MDAKVGTHINLHDISDECECQGRRSKVKVTEVKNVEFLIFSLLSENEVKGHEVKVKFLSRAWLPLLTRSRRYVNAGEFWYKGFKIYLRYFHFKTFQISEDISQCESYDVWSNAIIWTSVQIIWIHWLLIWEFQPAIKSRYVSFNDLEGLQEKFLAKSQNAFILSGEYTLHGTYVWFRPAMFWPDMESRNPIEQPLNIWTPTGMSIFCQNF